MAHGHIAIDGPAGSGKTTVARALARRLGILYLDTGAMYRAVAVAALRYGVPVDDAAAVARLAATYPVRVVLDKDARDGSRIFIGDEELGAELYYNDVSTVVSIVAAYPQIREFLVERQRAIGREAPVIMAGRDIGTVVLPDAPHKIFLTASLDARTERRRAELAERGNDVDLDELRAQLAERDRIDATREVAPLRAAPDAVEIDATEIGVDEVVEQIVALMNREDRDGKKTLR